MTTASTPLLGLALPVAGELDGTWGDVVNNQLTSLLEEAIAGTTTLSSDADVTLTTTALGTNQARAAILLWTAANAVTRNITAPAQSKGYLVVHAGGAGAIVLRGVGPTTGITIVSGEKCVAAWNGSDFVKVSTSVSSSGTVLTLPQINDTSSDHQYVFAVSELAADRTVTLPLLTGNDEFVFKDHAQTLANKTLTLPQINDTSADHQYVLAVSELAADRTVTLPLLTGNDVFVFADFIQTLTNKTLTSPVLTTPQINDTSANHQYVFAVSELLADRTVTLPLLTGNDEFVFKDHTQTLANKTLTSPAITGTILEDVYTIVDGAGFAIDPTNGSVQLITLGADRIPVAANWDAGESVTLMVADGTARTIDWTTSMGVVWVGGSAPTLATTGYTVLEFWKVGTTIYGARVGDVA